VINTWQFIPFDQHLTVYTFWSTPGSLYLLINTWQFTPFDQHLAVYTFWSTPGSLHLFNFAVVISSAEGLDSGTHSSTAYISICSIAETGNSSTCSEYYEHLQTTILYLYQVSLYTLYGFIYSSVQVSNLLLHTACCKLINFFQTLPC
jgi:hypothetical protein